MPNQQKDRLRRANPTGGKPFQGTKGNPAAHHPFRTYWIRKEPCRIVSATGTTFTIITSAGKPKVVNRDAVRKERKPARRKAPFTKRGFSISRLRNQQRKGGA